MARPPLPDPTITITKQTARRFVLAHHHLWPPRQLMGKEGVLRYIRHVGCIQFDPINVVGRNPDLVLQSRVKDYRPAMLNELLYEDRLLVDGFDKVASIYPVEDWPYFAYLRAHRKDRYGDSEIARETAPHVIEQIKSRGSLSSLDFKNQEKTNWHWGPTSKARAALESLYVMGKLGIHHRVRNRRYFDLIENLLPADVLNAPNPHAVLEAYQAWHVARRVRGLGLAHPNSKEHWLGILGVKSRRRREILATLVERGDLRAVRVKEIPQHTFFIHAGDLLTLEQAAGPASRPQEAAILAPLDNLLWDRKSLGWIFDFEYVWEVYKPKEKREYGYYVLPVIYGDRFVARFQPIFDKENKALAIQNWWWEEGVKPNPAMKEALHACLMDFKIYLQAEDVDFGGFGNVFGG